MVVVGCGFVVDADMRARQCVRSGRPSLPRRLISPGGSVNRLVRREASGGCSQCCIVTCRSAPLARRRTGTPHIGRDRAAAAIRAGTPGIRGDVLLKDVAGIRARRVWDGFTQVSGAATRGKPTAAAQCLLSVHDAFDRRRGPLLSGECRSQRAVRPVTGHGQRQTQRTDPPAAGRTMRSDVPGRPGSR
jgi:hypothetical protein